MSDPTAENGAPADPLEKLAQQAEAGNGAIQAQGLDATNGTPPAVVDPEAEERQRMIEGLATGVLVMLLSAGRAQVAKNLPEINETCPDELLQPPATELVKLGRDYLAKLANIAGSSSKLAPLAMALFPLVMAFVSAQQLHAEREKQKAPDASDQ